MGNSSIYCSNGLVLDATAPVFNGIEDNATYCVSRDFTVVEENLDTLTANGTVLIPVNGKYTLSQTGQNVVVAADKAGNSKTVTVTINASHVYDHDCEARTEVLPKIAPAIVEGKENVWNPTDGGTITFKSDAAFADFIRVTVDGIELDAANYELLEGGIIVTLKEEYLETLTVGTHILGIESVSGTAFTEFTVEAARTNPVINALTTFISVLLMILITFLRSYQVLHG